MPVCAKVAPAPRLEITIAKRSKRIGMSLATRDKKSATQLRGEVGRRLVRATSTLNKSHAAHVMGARYASSCQGSESTYVVREQREKQPFRCSRLPLGGSLLAATVVEVGFVLSSTICWRHIACSPTPLRASRLKLRIAISTPSITSGVLREH
jgi:hypothetical protein